MKTLKLTLGLILIVSTLAGCATAPRTEEQPPVSVGTTATVPANLPPLLDRNLFFDDPKLSGAQISPNGQFVSFRKPYNDILNIWVKKVDEPFEAARPITADTARPVIGYFWSEDSRYVLYVQDKAGNENYHVYAVDPAAAADPATGVPPARDLTPGENVVAFLYAVPEKTPNEIIVGMNDRDPALHDVYRLNIDTGERKLLVRNDQNVAAWIPDSNGNVRLAYRQAADGSNEVLRVEDGKLGKVIVRCTFEETCVPIRFHKDDKLVYMNENIGADIDLARLSLLDPETGALTPVESDPENQADFGGPVFSDRTEELVATAYVGDRVRVYPRDPAWQQIIDDLRAQLPDGELGISSMTSDDGILVVGVESDVHPGSAYIYDAKTRKATLLYHGRPDLPAEHLAPMRAVRYPTRDGVEIPAYLTVPKGAEPKNLPAIILPHGGPWARDMWGFDSFAQFLANRGYAVLQPNFRASTGYGKTFLNAGNKQWGTGIMQHDLSDGVKYLVDSGIADPKRVGIMGGSYGGYATLAGLAYTPELYAAGVSIVGPSNLFTLLNSIPPYWGPIRNLFLLRMGNPEIEADKAMLEAQSPLFSATKIEDPLLVIQGANDPRVKKAESDQIVVALRDLGRPVEYIVAPDEGHGFAGRDNRIAMFAAIETFLAKHLGGRYQSEMPAEIAAKLAAITVDPAKVEKPVVATALDAAKTAPLPVLEVSNVVPTTVSYKTTMNMGGREIALDSTRTYKLDKQQDREVWVVETIMKTPMGDAKETSVLDAASLRPISREASQGPAVISVAYGDTAVTGSIKASGQEIPIKFDLTAPAFGDQAALDTVITALPLAPGYRTTLRTTEVAMQQRPRYWSLEVTGEESVTVPAGTFDTYKVVMTPLDNEGGGQTFWVTKDETPVVVKSEAQLPAMMGGGVATTQLTAKEGSATATTTPAAPERPMSKKN